MNLYSDYYTLFHTAYYIKKIYKILLQEAEGRDH